MGLWGLCILLLSCTPKSITAEEIIDRCVEAHGGWTRFQDVKNWSLLKTTTRYDSLGIQASRTQQFQTFSSSPSSISIQYTEGKNTIHLRSEAGTITKFVNDSLITDQEGITQTKSALFAARFVFFQPFLLKEAFAKKKYLGKRKFLEEEAHAVQIRYPDSEDVWTFYFDADQFDLLGYLVLHNQRYSVIVFDEMQVVEGLKFSSKRSSYFTNATLDDLQLTGKYLYEDLKSY